MTDVEHLERVIEGLRLEIETEECYEPLFKTGARYILDTIEDCMEE